MIYNSIKKYLKIKYTGSFSTRVLCALASLFFLAPFGSGYAQSQMALGKYDGPYFFYEDEATKLIRVENGQIQIQHQPEDIFSVMTEDSHHRFEVSRHPIKTPDWYYPSSDTLLVLSDPHGDFESFFSILKAQKVIGKNYEWVFGKNNLVIIGDVFDRGKDVLPIFWLIYKLEYEADQAGGKVHFLLGNHEEMIMRGNYKYAQDKYKVLADSIGRDYRDFWAINTELGKWLQSKNTMEKIGDHLFVHAGLSRMMLDPAWTIPAVNDSVRNYLFRTKEERQTSIAGRFLFGSEGPLWYRGMVRQEEKYHPLNEEELNQILQNYKARKIYLGHTIFPDITSFYKGRVIAVNVNNELNRSIGRGRGILIMGNKTFVIYDDVKNNKLLEE